MLKLKVDKQQNFAQSGHTVHDNHFQLSPIFVGWGEAHRSTLMFPSMDKVKLTGQKLGRVFNSRLGKRERERERERDRQTDRQRERDKDRGRKGERRKRGERERRKIEERERRKREERERGER